MNTFPSVAPGGRRTKKVSKVKMEKMEGDHQPSFDDFENSAWQRDEDLRDDGDHPVCEEILTLQVRTHVQY